MKPSTLVNTLLTLIPLRQPVLVQGAPGVGKTAIVRRAAALLGHDLVVSHPSVADPTDYRGLPWMQGESARFFPIGEIATLVRATQPTLWFIDDIGQAPLTIQAALMQWIHASSRELNGMRIPECVTIVAATNRREDRAGVAGFLEPFKSRFLTILGLDVDFEDWLEWALAQSFEPSVISFLHYRPPLLSDFRASAGLELSPSPRGWESASTLMKVGFEEDVLHECLVGCIGQGAADELVGYRRILPELPPVDEILRDPEGTKIARDAVCLYALAGALAARADTETFGPLLRYMERAPEEFQVLFVRLAVGRDRAIEQTDDHRRWVTRPPAELPPAPPKRVRGKDPRVLLD